MTDERVSSAFNTESKESVKEVKRKCTSNNMECEYREFIRMNTITCKNSLCNFKRQLISDLFQGGAKEIEWKTLYYTIKKFGILASKTLIWNVFLDSERKAKANAEKGDKSLKKDSEMFKEDDLTDDRVTFLFHMTESYKQWKSKPVARWKADLVWAMFTNKFLKGNGCNFFNILIIFIMIILLVTVAVFPMGEGIFDTFLLCKIAMGIYGFGILWYFCSLLGENWYPYTYGGLTVNVLFMMSSASFCVLFAHALSPGYYDNHNCFKCPSCTETTDKLCFEFSKFTTSINHDYAEANTCSCAIMENLRINEPIIPYGQAAEYCGGEDCSCDAILSKSTENWDSSQDYFPCVYFSPTGTPLFFLFGSFVTVFMGINFFVSFFCVLYLVLMCMGCGKGNLKDCVCCFIDFADEQEEAKQSAEYFKDLNQV